MEDWISVLNPVCLSARSQKIYLAAYRPDWAMAAAGLLPLTWPYPVPVQHSSTIHEPLRFPGAPRPPPLQTTRNQEKMEAKEKDTDPSSETALSIIGRSPQSTLSIGLPPAGTESLYKFSGTHLCSMCLSPAPHVSVL